MEGHAASRHGTGALQQRKDPNSASFRGVQWGYRSHGHSHSSLHFLPPFSVLVFKFRLLLKLPRQLLICGRISKGVGPLAKPFRNASDISISGWKRFR